MMCRWMCIYPVLIGFRVSIRCLPVPRITLSILLAILFALPQHTAGQALNQQQPAESPGGLLNLPIRTLGGRQLWTDQVILDGWRIQQNVTTRHHRLLDENDVRHTWGTLDHCRAALDGLRRQGPSAEQKATAVIVLHGLGRPRASMKSLAQFLAEDDQWQVVNMSYASTRAALDEHALALASVIDHLEDIQQLHFVGHSLGNLVVRRYFHMVESGQIKPRDDLRWGRMVMLAPPNQGSQMAQQLSDREAFLLLTGPCGEALARDWEATAEQLATPPLEFGIIAGSGLNVSGLDSPLIEGDDDFIVSVDETKLDGAADFLVLPVIHALMMHMDSVQEATRRFLQVGSFRESGERTPLAGQ